MGDLFFTARSTAVRRGIRVAGAEPLRYVLDSHGTCSNHETDLGLKIVYQSFYSEIVGSVDPIPDATMISLLLPVALRKRDPA